MKAYAIAVALVIGVPTVVAAAPASAAHAVAVQPRVQPPNGWVRKDLGQWVYWIPNNKWVDAHSANGITISSPTGDLVVDYGFASWPTPLQLGDLRDYLVQELAKPSNIGAITITSMKAGPAQGVAGDQTQRFAWKGSRQHPLKGRQQVQGIMYLHVMSDGFGANGFEAFNVFAPVSQWAKTRAMLEIIRSNIYEMPTG